MTRKKRKKQVKNPRCGARVRVLEIYEQLGLEIEAEQVREAISKLK